MAELREQLQATLGDAYSLEQELTGGGMSRVFVAQETALARKVVIKVLPPEMAAAVSMDRFRREIQFAAQLQHPHIVPLLSAGETGGLPYFTMPFVKGESLRARLARGGELPISESMRILREVAAALAYAHENGVVHRDIKPENILISGDSAMVTDFGVAKAVSASSGGGEKNLTSLGVALGTPAYMAPEQATADPNTDHRADIYALGIVAYEMLTGSTPFIGRSPQGILAAHVTETPDAVTRRRPAIPPGLANLVMHSIEKRPADRFQTAAAVVHELDALTTPSGGLAPTAAVSAVAESKSLRRFARPAVMAGAAIVLLALITFAAKRVDRTAHSGETSGEVPAIAVLPFENRGRIEGQEFTDGMTEEITNRLSDIRGLRVIGRQSARSYEGTHKTPQQIAQELGVQYVLTGTVRWDKSSDGKELVRVSPALLRAGDATQVWANAYQTVLSGMFEVQAKVAIEVADALNIALLAPERRAIAAKPTENVDAYGFYLRGNELLLGHSDVRSVRAAIGALEKAVESDPRFALAYSRLSQAHTELFWFYGDRSAGRLQKAKAAVDKALSLDPSIAAAHFALGVYYYHGFLDYEKALKEFTIAERLRPNDFETIFYVAALERRQGKWKESIANMLRASEIEPRVAAYMSDVAFSYMALRQYDDAARLAERALIISPQEIDARNLMIELAIARDGDVAKAVGIVRKTFDAASDRDDAAGQALAIGWPATLDRTVREAAAKVPWSPDRGEKGRFFVQKMFLHAGQNDSQRARGYADSAIRILTGKIRERPDEAEFYMGLADAHAILGHRTEALAANDRAIAVLPVSKDAYYGPESFQDRAVILTILGDLDGAAAVLERLLAIPSQMSRNRLRLDPAFAPLHTNPRFQKLVASSDR